MEETYNKYSITPTPKIIYLLITNGINFIHRKGLQSQRYRIFFIATPEYAETLTEETGWYACNENDGWDFDNWAALERH